MASKDQIQKKKSKTKKKVCFIGDKDKVEKANRKQLINSYLQYIGISNQRGSYKMFSREYNDLTIDIDIHDLSEKNESIINESECVIIVFDMNNSIAFNNLLDEWLIWLRDTCKYNKKIGIIGNYSNNPDSIHYRITNEEVYDLIISSETSPIFIHVGLLSEEEKGKAIDQLINNIFSFNMPKVIEEGGCILI